MKHLLTLLLLVIAHRLSAQMTIIPTAPGSLLSRLPRLEVGLSSSATLDTLTQYLDRRTGLGFYSSSTPSGLQALTGTCNEYISLGVKYSFSGTGRVVGVLAAYGQKQIHGAPDTMFATIYAANPAQDNLPSTPIGEQWFTTDRIDTTSSGIVFTPIMFQQPVPISSNFVAFVTTYSLQLNGDSADGVFLYSNMQGDGQGERRACYITFDFNTSQFVTGNLQNLPFTINGAPIDLDPFIIPIVELDAPGGLQQAGVFNGIRLLETSPNPASDHAVIRCSLEKPSAVDLLLLDGRGRVVRTLRSDERSTGERLFHVDLAGLPSGTYTCLITTEQGRAAGRMTIVR